MWPRMIFHPELKETHQEVGQAEPDLTCIYLHQCDFPPNPLPASCQTSKAASAAGRNLATETNAHEQQRAGSYASEGSEMVKTLPASSGGEREE